MLIVPPRIKVFAALMPTDMLKSFCGLTGIVEKEFDQQTEDGDLFLFFNRLRNHFDAQHELPINRPVRLMQTSCDHFTTRSLALLTSFPPWETVLGSRTHRVSIFTPITLFTVMKKSCKAAIAALQLFFLLLH
jgi:hypothetical protein